MRVFRYIFKNKVIIYSYFEEKKNRFFNVCCLVVFMLIFQQKKILHRKDYLLIFTLNTNFGALINRTKFACGAKVTFESNLFRLEESFLSTSVAP